MDTCCPLLRPKYIVASLNIRFKPYITRTNVGGLVARPCQNHSPHSEVAGSTPLESIKFYHDIQPKGASWQPTTRTRGTTSFDRKKKLITKSFAHLYASVYVLSACQLTVTSLYGLYSQLPRQHCTDYTVNKYFACLAKQIERDIFCIRCLFELVQVVLGS
jgi:hypothetical protein